MKSEWALETGSGTSQKLELVILPELRAELPASLRLTAIGRLRTDAYDRVERGSERPQETSKISHRRIIGDRTDIELREFFLDADLGPVFLRLGKQQVVWGETDGLKLLDVVNPQDFREFILPDFEDSRIPLWTVNAEIPLGEALLQLIWVLDPSADELPEPRSVFAFSSPRLVPRRPPGVPTRLRNPDRPRAFVEGSDAGARLSAFLGGWDLSLAYLYHYNDRPAFRAAPALVGGMPGVELNIEYERSHLVGATASRGFRDWTLRAELAWESDEPLPSTATKDRSTQAADLAYAIGVDWYGLEETLLSVQLFQSWLTTRPQGLARDTLDTNVTFLAQRDFWNDALMLQSIWIHNVNDGDGLARGKATYELMDGLYVWGGIDVFYGTRKGIFGQYDSEDRLVFGFEWGF
ncbi:MAG: hypothetical protein QNK03_17850 [Myxococcota bacterium]|nr:hypothetical protein [Myxococcota bacterium]